MNYVSEGALLTPNRPPEVSMMAFAEKAKQRTMNNSMNDPITVFVELELSYVTYSHSDRLLQMLLEFTTL